MWVSVSDILMSHSSPFLRTTPKSSLNVLSERMCNAFCYNTAFSTFHNYHLTHFNSPFMSTWNCSKHVLYHFSDCNITSHGTTPHDAGHRKQCIMGLSNWQSITIFFISILTIFSYFSNFQKTLKLVLCTVLKYTVHFIANRIQRCK